MNDELEPQIDKRTLVIIGAVAFAVVLGIIFYQIGYESGSKSIQADAQQSIPHSTVTQPVESEKANKPRDPITLGGVGQQASSKIDLIEGLATVKMSHTGNAHFSIWVLDDGGERVELLVNETGRFDGSKAFKVPSDGKYILDVSADGTWDVSIQQ